MGTRGFRVIRYRKRYYAVYNHLDSYPEGLGNDIASGIPKTPELFAKYLQDLLEHMKIREAQLTEYLCKDPSDYVQGYRGSIDVIIKRERSVEEETELGLQHWGDTELIPIYVPPGNDLWIEWVYTVDLDNLAFTINNSGHLSLANIPGDDWIHALTDGVHVDKVFLAEKLPSGTITGIAAPMQSVDPGLLDHHDSLDVHFVKAQGIAGFPPNQRHGPIFRACLFQELSEFLIAPLSATLLSWNAEDFPFREMAFVILSLASSSNTALAFNDDLVTEPRTGFSRLQPRHRIDHIDGKVLKPEFLAHFWTGSHLRYFQPGSAPDGTSYWFDGALVHLVSRLDHPDSVRAGITTVQRLCLAERPGRSSNALLLSVEHIVLLRIYGDGKRVDRTEVRSLFDIGPHWSLDQRDRYRHQDILSQLQARDAEFPHRGGFARARQRRGRGNHLYYEDNKRHTVSTFYCLAHFLEASARKELQPGRVSAGVFPMEVYGLVLQNLKDVETSRACMHVSRAFRDVCLERWMVSDGLATTPSKITREYEWKDAGYEAQPSNFEMEREDAEDANDTQFGTGWRIVGCLNENHSSTFEME